MRLKYNLESEIECGGPEEEDEDPVTDTDCDEDDRIDHDFPGRDITNAVDQSIRDANDIFEAAQNRIMAESRRIESCQHRHAYRDESPYCSCGKNLDA